MPPQSKKRSSKGKLSVDTSNGNGEPSLRSMMGGLHEPGSAESTDSVMTVQSVQSVALEDAKFNTLGFKEQILKFGKWAYDPGISREEKEPNVTDWDAILDSFKGGRKGLSQLVVAFDKWGEHGLDDAVSVKQVQEVFVNSLGAKNDNVTPDMVAALYHDCATDEVMANSLPGSPRAGGGGGGGGGGSASHALSEDDLTGGSPKVSRDDNTNFKDKVKPSSRPVKNFDPRAKGFRWAADDESEGRLGGWRAPVTPNKVGCARTTTSPSRTTPNEPLQPLQRIHHHSHCPPSARQTHVLPPPPSLAQPLPLQVVTMISNQLRLHERYDFAKASEIEYGSRELMYPTAWEVRVTAFFSELPTEGAPTVTTPSGEKRVTRFEALRQIFSEKAGQAQGTAEDKGFPGLEIGLTDLVDGLQKMGLVFIPLELGAFYRDLGGKESKVTLDQFVGDVKRARRVSSWASELRLSWRRATPTDSDSSRYSPLPPPTLPSYPLIALSFHTRQYRIMEREEEQRPPWDELFTFVVERKGQKAANANRHAVVAAAKQLYKEMDHHNGGLNADQLCIAMSRIGFRLTDAETRALHRDCDPNSEGLIVFKDFAAAFSLAKTREADARKKLKKEEKVRVI